MIHKLIAHREPLKLNLICINQNSRNLEKTKMSSKLSDFPKQLKKWLFAAFVKVRSPNRTKLGHFPVVTYSVLSA